MGLVRVILWTICASLPGMVAAQDVAVETTVGAMAPNPDLALDPDDTFEAISPLAPANSLRPAQRRTWQVRAARWDNHPRGARWTRAVLSALRGHGAPLLDVVPRDIDQWCPGYVHADTEGRAAFWAGLMSTLAWHESTHRPHAVGGGGRWFGLVQISPGTARFRNCNVRSGQALLDGSANLSCAIRIMAVTVPRDGVVSDGNRGVAADWGPMHSSQRRKREDMRNWMLQQDYCEMPVSGIRPQQRPDAIATPHRRMPIMAEPVPRPAGIAAPDTSAQVQ